jgi:hypothetical protein
MRFLNHLADALNTDDARTTLSPVTRAMIVAYFDGSISEAKRYADHHFVTHRFNPTWVVELAAQS